MGANGENGDWCAPTRELDSSKLLALVHQTREIITDSGVAEPVEIRESTEDVVLLVSRKPEGVPAPAVLADGSQISYPVYRDRLRPLRVVLAVTVPLTALAALLFVLLAR